MKSLIDLVLVTRMLHLFSRACEVDGGDDYLKRLMVNYEEKVNRSSFSNTNATLIFQSS